MRHKKGSLLTAGVFLVTALALVLAPAWAKKPARSVVPLAEDVFTWQLNDPTVVDPPEVSETDEGILVTGYAIEAAASASEDSAPLTRGKFRLALTIFRPKVDMPGQKAGVWYLRGSWTLNEESPNPKARRARHGPGILKGDLSAELSFNPLTHSGAVNARVRLPMSHQGGAWGRGQGTFTGNELFAGQMSVKLDRRLAAN